LMLSLRTQHWTLSQQITYRHNRLHTQAWLGGNRSLAYLQSNHVVPIGLHPLALVPLLRRAIVSLLY